MFNKKRKLNDKSSKVSQVAKTLSVGNRAERRRRAKEVLKNLKQKGQ